jgi:hypothetical protein
MTKLITAFRNFANAPKNNNFVDRFHLPSGLKGESAADRLPRLRIRIPSEAQICLVIFMCVVRYRSLVRTVSLYQGI